ncbi:MAG: tetratricopeptide repeat protein, partial [Kiritimatiellia bacterium]|nr:tetratricopeptide repeat protein [Kiritimatiellia bacterium]
MSDRILSSPKRPRYARAAELALQQSNPREFPGARQEFLALVRKEPDDPFPRWLLAHIDQMYGDDKEAVAQYEILISKTAAPVGWLHEGKARALLASGRIEAAVTEARLAVKHQESAASLRLLNRALLRAGRVEESIEPMARLVSNDHFGIRDWNHNYLFRPLIPLMSRDPKDRERYMDAVWGASLEQPLEQLRKGALFQRLGHGDIALRAYQAASRSENSRLRAQALFGIGDILFYGAPGVRQDRVAAIPHLQEAANLGDPDAMLMLGYALQNGLEVEKDFSRAAALFEEAHRRGSFVAASNLGNLVKNGQGTEKDPARALYLYRKAMRFGFADAFNNAAYFMATTPEFWDADRAKAWSEYAVSRETNGAWLNTLYSVYKRAEEWDKAETAWRRWEKWWRSSGNHGQEMPERWARRRDLLDEKLKTFVSKPPPQPPMADSDADVPEKTAPAIEVGDTPAQIAPLLLEFRDREQPTDAQKRWALATM